MDYIVYSTFLVKANKIRVVYDVGLKRGEVLCNHKHFRFVAELLEALKDQAASDRTRWIKGMLQWDERTFSDLQVPKEVIYCHFYFISE